MGLTYVENKRDHELELLAPRDEPFGFEELATPFKPMSSRLWVSRSNSI